MAFMKPCYNQIARLRPDPYLRPPTPKDGLNEVLLHEIRLRSKRHGDPGRKRGRGSWCELIQRAYEKPSGQWPLRAKTV